MEKPIQNTSDYAHKLTKGALGAIPFAGAFVGELMEMVIVPQYEKKLEKWFEFVDETLKYLIADNQKTKKDFFENEEFQSIFQKSSRVYLNNVEKDKIPLLKVYLKSAIREKTELNKKLIFLEMLENLTVKHLLILKDVADNENSSDYKYQEALTEQLTKTYADGDKSYYKLLEKGLQNYHLLGYWSADVVENNKNQWNLRTSKIGKELIEFVTE